ncbi:MAG: molybdenum cofactor guanylyltransferase [Betaproteobacteria bacterium]|nr:molybdenum cofactor guanylyltransferase [Betaproteobacteria bacterium]NBT74458.1 molybdenum cofactor guanylyltransferase [Betaproteobacteria bacterium]NBY13797.1 molybdenum cofactor guanylyltransferase [Betaproteobacteria bacterium]NCA15501.1 molybdenum cofactor guanylyltransferase [Betaproteobacteria bacterium]NDF03761.1 molybdenum cofactor guanylyltransferase [Betaproteobacteria bacterium]
MHPDGVCGLVLSGGRGARMLGEDKGLLRLGGEALAARAIRRLAPQVQSVLVSANRNHSEYAQLGVPVVSDLTQEFLGPLAGVAAARSRCDAQWVQVVPCDVPDFPLDLVERLLRAAKAAGAQLALPVTQEDGGEQAHPVFLLIRASLFDALDAYLASGGRSAQAWAEQMGAVRVCFDEADAFLNLNTPESLDTRERRQS